MPTYIDDLLTIQVKEDAEQVRVLLTGRSTARKPNHFLVPILKGALEDAAATDKRVILDFFQLDYMNSATITPIVRVLEAANKGKSRVTIQYNRGLNWQDISFTALALFQTEDGRVVIQGLD